MSRLSSEFERLYPSPAAAGGGAPQGARAFVLELRRPLDWSALGRVHRGVQADLGLPAPAIAVSGEGLQLWFSLREPVEADRARAFLAALEQRWLAEVLPRQVVLHVAAGLRVPALQEGTDHWSAFVAPDLVSMFAETPWLDVEPNDEGQANLLRGLQSAGRAEFEAAERRLAEDAATPAGAAAPAVDAPRDGAPPTTDPRQFLLSVMNDPSAPLALRIEAAKALLR